MNNDEIIAKMREGLDKQIHQAIERDDVSFEHVHAVMQSWLLLQILDKLHSIDESIMSASSDSDGIISAIRDNTMGRI